MPGNYLKAVLKTTVKKKIKAKHKHAQFQIGSTEQTENNTS